MLAAFPPPTRRGPAAPAAGPRRPTGRAARPEVCPLAGLPASTHDDLMPVRVLVVDDHALFRGTVRRLLTDAGFAVVGEAADGASGITAYDSLRPELVLLDVQLPDLDGFQVARELARRPAPPAVVLVSGRDASDYGGLVESSSAIGFLAKADLTGVRLHELLRRRPST